MTPRAAATSTILAWISNLATRMLANSLNMPEPLLVSTGVFVYARVQEVEQRAARKLSPARLRRRLRGMLRRW
jgi:hypothetical protein